MLNFGIIGMNEGNGHPYSFAASFNGFNEKALENECDFPIIIKYLKEHHRNQEFIPDARVSYVYTQDRALSERIARISNIPHVADSIDELVQNTDGIIFARDDMWNHWDMAGELFKSGKPIYMDKLLGHTEEDLKKFIRVIGDDYPLLTASSYQFAPNVVKAAAEMPLDSLRLVRGISPVIWIRYAPHLLGALFRICGNDIVSVQNSGRDREDTVTLTYRSGLQAVMQIFEGVSLPLGLDFHFNSPQGPIEVPYTDPTLESYFLSIANMMKEFTNMVLTGKKTVSLDDMYKTNAIVLAAVRSREEGGRKVFEDEFMQMTRI